MQRPAGAVPLIPFRVHAGLLMHVKRNQLGTSTFCLQAEYHQQKFRVFPHIDSPASLIKGLADRVPATASQVK